MEGITRTDSQNPDFTGLVKKLDVGLAITDGDDHAFYNQFNKIDRIKYVILVYESGIAVGCGALKEYNSDTMEIKRMFVDQESRGKGIASGILVELEIWAKELSYKRCILETGIRQTEAIGLYKKNGFSLISNYGQYAGLEGSLCFEKAL